MVVAAMFSVSILTGVRTFLWPSNVLEKLVRYGHQRCTKNKCHPPHPKRRRVWRSTGKTVTPGTMIVTQRRLRFLPGSNVGFGKNGTLFAMVPGRVYVSCEVWNTNWDHTWVQRVYGGREGQTIYKKYFNVIPRPLPNRFKLIDTV